MTKIPSKDIPQADSLEKVGDLIALMDADITSRDELASELDIDPRQVLYYLEAARILGWLDKQTDGSWTITPRGEAYLKVIKPADKSGVLNHSVTDTEFFKQLLERFTEPELSRENITEFLRENTTLTGTTLGRRAQSIVAWLKTITQIDPEDYQSLARRAVERAPTQVRAYRDTEEGLPHQRLKDAIANDPSLLGEDLTLVRAEYQFPTNDRIDLLFIDAKKRFLAVEVEIDVDALDMAGLLQAVKYRAMLQVQFGRSASQVRGMLVARTIHAYMKEKAERYGIETREIENIV